MRLTSDGLIIRDITQMGEADRFLVVLTRQFGVIRVAARGVRQVKNRNAGATQLLCYAQLVLQHSRDTYYLDTARPERMFFELRESIDTLSLAQYFCELADVLAPRDEPAEEFLRLMLNALHLLGEGKLPFAQIKAVTELRALALSGYGPLLGQCAVCGQPPKTAVLLPRSGVVCCDACRQTAGGMPLSDAALAAMRHICTAPLERLFSFRLPASDLKLLGTACEQTVLEQTGRTFKTLEFYRSLQNV